MGQLTGLLLGDTQVSDKGLAHLRGLKNLEMLGLKNTHVTNAGLVYLHEMKKLKELVTQGTQVTREGRKALRTIMPLVNVPTSTKRAQPVEDQ
jgi:hypothetical protein